MARISKEEHPRILCLVDVEHCRVADVATEYGCTPANIYALLAKLRRAATPDTSADAAEASNTAPPEAPRAVPAPQPEEAGPARRPRMPAPPTPVAAATAPEVPLLTTGDADRREPNPASEPPGAVTAVAPRPQGIVPSSPPAPGRPPAPPQRDAARARAGVGLMMRTAEGEESLTPFRSLDDLLSAIKPILRAAARSPDAVWFSIQPVDLASLKTDAA